MGSGNKSEKEIRKRAIYRTLLVLGKAPTSGSAVEISCGPGDRAGVPGPVHWPLLLQKPDIPLQDKWLTKREHFENPQTTARLGRSLFRSRNLMIPSITNPLTPRTHVAAFCCLILVQFFRYKSHPQTYHKCFRAKKPPNSYLCSKYLAGDFVQGQISKYLQIMTNHIRITFLTFSGGRTGLKQGLCDKLFDSESKTAFGIFFLTVKPVLKTVPYEFHPNQLDSIFTRDQERHTKGCQGRAGSVVPVQDLGPRLSGCRGPAAPSCSLQMQTRSPFLEGKNNITKGKIVRKVLNQI